MRLYEGSMQMRLTQVTGQRIHFCLTTVFAILLVPAGVYTRLRIVPSLSSCSFLFAWAFQSIIWAALLFQFGTPGSWTPYRRGYLRLVPAILMGIGLAVVFGTAGAEVAIAALALVEFNFRRGDWRKAANALLPWLYLAGGIQAALYYSSVIVTLRPCTEFDAALSRLDSLLMFGGTVVRLSSACASLYTPAEIIYYSMGGVMGAGILFLCLAGDRRAAFQMSGAILVAYYVSLVVFYFFPAQGPFITAGLPPQMLTAAVQRMSLGNAKILYRHTGWLTPPLAYYVAFPSLHVAQPLIAGWFLRRWRAVSLIVFIYCGLLVAAIVILRWHYLVDILGGLAVACLAVVVASVGSRRFNLDANDQSRVSDAC
jgi:hypothetical protein